MRSPRTSRSAEGASPSAGHDVIGAEYTDLRARLTRLKTQIARLVEFITDGERSPATDANLMALEAETKGALRALKAVADRESRYATLSCTGALRALQHAFLLPFEVALVAPTDR